MSIERELAHDRLERVIDRLQSERDLLLAQAREDRAHALEVERLLIEMVGEVWEAAQGDARVRAADGSAPPPYHFSSDPTFCDGYGRLFRRGEEEIVLKITPVIPPSGGGRK